MVSDFSIPPNRSLRSSPEETRLRGPVRLISVNISIVRFCYSIVGFLLLIAAMLSSNDLIDFGAMTGSFFMTTLGSRDFGVRRLISSR